MSANEGFSIDGILYDQDKHERVIKAGCHNILISEVENLFGQKENQK